MPVKVMPTVISRRYLAGAGLAIVHTKAIAGRFDKSSLFAVGVAKPINKLCFHKKKVAPSPARLLFLRIVCRKKPRSAA